MVTDSAKRFAQVSINLFSHEGTFRIEVPNGEDFDRIACEFERVGCAVERERRGRCLVVTPPGHN
ncbi:hypothetical protein EON82_08755 [bacterium]|nr:MAG: hypothetical protein EON82_08755 [bacterium]